MNKNTASWILRLVPAVIIGQTLAFKFSGAAESVALFRDLAISAFGNASLEPALRIGTGVIELITVVLLLIPKDVRGTVNALEEKKHRTCFENQALCSQLEDSETCPGSPTDSKKRLKSRQNFRKTINQNY